MQKLYEISKVLKVQKIIGSAETIRGNMVSAKVYAHQNSKNGLSQPFDLRSQFV